MNVCFFNTTQNGSTGSIVKVLATEFKNEGHNVLCVFGQKTQEWNDIKCLFTIKNIFRKYLNKCEARFDGRDGFINSFNTRKALKEIKRFKPDIIHLHNMHGEWINLKLIMKYANDNNIPVVLTAHDCWIETGRCGYYSFHNCDRYKIGCGKCPARLNYPKLYLFDRSKHYWKLKRKCLSNLKLVFSPSNWLKNELIGGGITTKIEVVGNPYDDKVFYLIDKEKKEKEDKRTIGFCSFVWNESKGLSMAQQIAEHYVKQGDKVVFIGMSNDDEKLPKGAIGITRTNSREELANLYRSFDVFVNPTKQDNFPTVNLEAMACGVPIVVARVGGAYEILTEEWEIGIIKEYKFEYFVESIDKILNLKSPLKRPESFNNMKYKNFAKLTMQHYIKYHNDK